MGLERLRVANLGTPNRVRMQEPNNVTTQFLAQLINCYPSYGSLQSYPSKTRIYELKFDFNHCRTMFVLILMAPSIQIHR